ncbi:hypothetical protein AGMMS49975_00560 [Clostridia bacterium]|nr:hypothetical protein AGMMS49975_00560 [Clostridia bacterium]
MIVPFLVSYVTSEIIRDFNIFGLLMGHMVKKHNLPIIAKEEYFKPESARNFFDRNSANFKKLEVYGYNYIFNHKDSEFDNIEHYAVPAELEEKLTNEHNQSINDMYLYLLRERCAPFEEWLNSVIDEIEKKHHEKIDAFFSVPSSQLRSFRAAAEMRGIKIICTDAGLFRPPVYINTMYVEFSRLGGADSEKNFEKRYEDFLAQAKEIKILTKKQILSIFLSEDYLGYLDIQGKEAKYKIGIATGYSYYAPYLSETHYNDEELIYSARRLYKPSEVVVRRHPHDPAGAAYPMLVDNYDDSTNSTEFILKCERVASLASNVTIEAAFWERASYSLKESHIRHKSIKDLRRKALGVIDDKYLNFYAFCALIPFDFLMDMDYLAWRVSEPTELEIYNRHLDYYLIKEGINRNIFNLKEDESVPIARNMRGGGKIIKAQNDTAKPAAQQVSPALKGLSQAQIQEAAENYYKVINSTSWKLTAPIRKFTDASRKNRERKKLRNKSSLLSEAVYISDYQNNIDFSGKTPQVKTIAFYLPQFHTIKENDEWWGKGFVEWVNTRKCKPRFKGHYQPREPHRDIGYYDLSDIETMKKQVKLAKQHGIYAFCFYLYWFSGKRLLEKPLDMFLEHPEIDINFCLCWANENWTKRWDGHNQDVLMKQDYSYNDPENFIKDIKKYVSDDRYIRINGKPLIIVYKPIEIAGIERVFSDWRKYAKEQGIGEILIWTCQTMDKNAKTLNIAHLVDADVEFPVHNLPNHISKIAYTGKQHAKLFSYRQLVEHTENSLKIAVKNTLPVYRTCVAGWDNSSRRTPESGLHFWLMDEFSLEYFYRWVKAMKDEAIKKFDEQNAFIFVNAWNEWAEGTYLEPDKKYGYANINTLSKAIMGLPFDDSEIK